MCMNTENLTNKLTLLWGDSRCPMCKNSDWEIIPRVFHIPQNILEDVTSTRCVPMIPIVCKRCKLILQVHSDILDDEVPRG